MRIILFLFFLIEDTNTDLRKKYVNFFSLQHYFMHSCVCTIRYIYEKKFTTVRNQILSILISFCQVFTRRFFSLFYFNIVKK